MPLAAVNLCGCLCDYHYWVGVPSSHCQDQSVWLVCLTAGLHFTVTDWTCQTEWKKLGRGGAANGYGKRPSFFTEGDLEPRRNQMETTFQIRSKCLYILFYRNAEMFVLPFLRCCRKTSLMRRLQEQTLPDATPSIE